MKNLLLLLMWSTTLIAAEGVTFPSKDGLTITAEYYPAAKPDAPFILLCHQAGWSRGEYKETAPWLNQQGFACLAIDQRSGGEVNGVTNQTHQAADQKGLATDYMAAKQDMEAALDYISATWKPKKLILVGSSYSAALAFRIAGEGKHALTAVMCYSPGEYFKPKTDYLAEVAAQIKVPIFITSASDEESYWKDFASKVPADYLNTFLPGVKGEHGSRALWSSKNGHELYRVASLAFLNNI